MSLPKTLKRLRIERGLTQTALAKQTGLPQSHISRLEKGQHVPTGLTIKRIADALGVEIVPLDMDSEELAALAFHVMMRRGWGVSKNDFGWKATGGDMLYWQLHSQPWYADPFTALVEADKWYRENVEGARHAEVSHVQTG